MRFVRLTDKNTYDDDYIIKLPYDLLNNEECMKIITKDIEHYGLDKKGTLIIDEPYIYLETLANFYGSYPPDVDVFGVKAMKPYEDMIINKDKFLKFIMAAFSFVVDDHDKIINLLRKVSIKEDVYKHTDYISFMYGRHKYKLSQYQAKIICTVSMFSSENYDALFRIIGYSSLFVGNRGYNEWFTLKYYLPLFNRDVPDPYKIDWLKIQNPKEVLYLLSDEEIENITDIKLSNSYYRLISRYELIESVCEGMKKERFRYIKRNLVVCEPDEIYSDEFSPDDKGELTYGIQSGDVKNAYLKCINEESLAEYFTRRNGFYAPYNNKRLPLEDVSYLYDQTDSEILKDVIAETAKKSNKSLINDLFSENKDNVINFIKNLFYSGMYIRRWKGPGHEYPINEESTKISICSFLKHKDPEYLRDVILSSPENFDAEIVESIKNNDFNIDIESNVYLQYSFENYIREYLQRLQENINIQPELGSLIFEDTTFDSYYEDLMNSKLCIRVSSKNLILFAWNLTKEIRDHINPNDIIPNFNDDMAKKIESVSFVPKGESENPFLN